MSCLRFLRVNNYHKKEFINLFQYKYLNSLLSEKWQKSLNLKNLLNTNKNE